MTRIIIVDDHDMLLRGLSLLFETIDGCDVVATTTDGRRLGMLIHKHSPDVIVTDAVMPDYDGLAVVKDFGYQLPVIVLTTFDDARLVRSLVDAGCAGYLLKDISPEDLAHAIESVASGGMVLDPRITRVMRSTGPTSLTRAERSVAELVAEGINNREIAARLHLAEGTVKNHVSSLLRKLDAPDRTVLALKLARSFGYL